jgi:hypothetical protein
MYDISVVEKLRVKLQHAPQNTISNRADARKPFECWLGRRRASGWISWRDHAADRRGRPRNKAATPRILTASRSRRAAPSYLEIRPAGPDRARPAWLVRIWATQTAPLRLGNVSIRGVLYCWPCSRRFSSDVKVQTGRKLRPRPWMNTHAHHFGCC